MERERLAHTERDIHAENRRIRSRFPHADRYPSKFRIQAVLDGHVRDLSGKIVLDYGCGTGAAVIQYLRAGAKKVFGMDISEKYIEKAKALCVEKGYPPERYDLRVMDAHNLEYEAGTFDYAIGLGVLHHLDTKTALDGLHRVLKPGGRLLLLEPLADNPLLKLFRWLTPRARTPDEHPFTAKDIAGMFPSSAWTPEMSYAGIIEAPVSVLTGLLMPSRVGNFLLRSADRLESWVNKRQILPSWNQCVLFSLVRK